MLGVTGYDAQMADRSVGGDQELRARAGRVADRAAAVDPSAIGADDAITAAVVIQQALALIDRIDAAMGEYSVTDLQFAGPAAALLTYLPMAPLSTQTHADAFPERLRGVPAYLEGVVDRHRMGATAGRVPVWRLLEAAVAHLDRCLADSRS
jgi:uncharacterized protein (DUF885 family)